MDGRTAARSGRGGRSSRRSRGWRVAGGLGAALLLGLRPGKDVVQRGRDRAHGGERRRTDAPVACRSAGRPPGRGRRPPPPPAHSRRVRTVDAAAHVVGRHRVGAVQPVAFDAATGAARDPLILVSLGEVTRGDGAIGQHRGGPVRPAVERAHAHRHGRRRDAARDAGGQRRRRRSGPALDEAGGEDRPGVPPCHRRA